MRWTMKKSSIAVVVTADSKKADLSNPDIQCTLIRLDLRSGFPRCVDMQFALWNSVR